MSTTTILLVIGAIILFYIASLYNWFQTALTRINASLQEIGNQLKRQASLIPNLESSAKAYLKHEKDIFKDITTARKAIENATGGDMAKIDKAEQAISTLLPKLQVLVESNPEIKAEKVIGKLMDELTDTADKLTYSRRVFIDLTADYNQKILTFPKYIIANFFGFKSKESLNTASTGSHVSVSEKEIEDPKISL